MPRLAKRTIPWSSLLPFVGAAAAIFSTCCRCDLLTLDKRGHTDEIQIRNLGRQDKDRTAVENLLEQARKMSARMYGNGSWEQVEATSQAFARGNAQGHRHHHVRLASRAEECARLLGRDSCLVVRFKYMLYCDSKVSPFTEQLKHCPMGRPLRSSRGSPQAALRVHF